MNKLEVDNLNFSANKIYLNCKDNKVRSYDIYTKSWRNIDEADGIRLFREITGKENFDEAVEEIKSRKTVKPEVNVEDDYCFGVFNLRQNVMKSDELKDFIISKTKGTFDNSSPVRKEISGKRPSLLKEYIELLNYTQYTNVFLIVSSRKYNSDKNTRYCVFVEKDYPDITEIFNDFVGVYKITQKDNHSDVSTLSKWFRETLGYGFCVTDIDFIIINENKVLVVEEKNGETHNTSRGQEIARFEILKEVLRDGLNKKYLYVEVKNEENILCELYNENETSQQIQHHHITDVISEIIRFLGGANNDRK